MKVHCEMGGGGNATLSSLFPIRVNVEDRDFDRNIKLACKRDLPWLVQQSCWQKHAVIVGGGPSLKDTIEQIKERKDDRQHVFALNNTGHWLKGMGIEPDAQILLDARPSNARFLVSEPLKCYIASQCAPETFDRALELGHKVTLWHPHVEGIHAYIGDRETALIGGGTTVGLQAMSICYALGYRNLHLNGFDSSYRGEDHHAYDQPENINDVPVLVECGGKQFRCAKWMIHQADGFVSTARQLADLGCTITVAGDGLIPTLAREMMK